MNNLSQPPQPTEPDMALLYLGSLFETLDYTLPPERDEAKLDVLAWHILDKRPKTLLGLAIRARVGAARIASAELPRHKRVAPKKRG